MAVTVFKDTSYNLSGLLSRIEHGEIALPDIQRPFVLAGTNLLTMTISPFGLHSLTST